MKHLLAIMLAVPPLLSAGSKLIAEEPPINAVEAKVNVLIGSESLEKVPRDNSKRTAMQVRVKIVWSQLALTS